MTRRLGLDIGTNSIGWCLVETGNSAGGIVDIGVRIFSDGRDAKTGASLAVDRRNARAMRRRRDRYLGRRSAFMTALVAYGLMPADGDEAKLLADLDPYDLRKRALDEALSPHEVGRALFHLNQRRGFKSNRKAERKADAEDGKIASAAQALDRAMAEMRARTLGEFLYGRETKRVRMDSAAQAYDFYPERQHLEAEFEAIWEAQRVHNAAVLTDPAKHALHRILFFQRPLKFSEVGVCAFVTSERRLPKAHPLFQERRLYEEVNQLEITSPGEASRKLTLDERDLLIRKLRQSRSASFTSLAKLLKLAPGQSFNKASETRKELMGDEVFAVMSDKKRFGNRWAFIDPDRQWTIVERLLNEDDPERLGRFLNKDCGLSEEQASAAASAHLPDLYGRLGETASRRILEQLKLEVITYAEAVRRCGWHHSDRRTGEVLTHLPYYGELLAADIPPGSQDPRDDVEKRWGKITNPTVHIGLGQVRKLVNAVIDRHGRPDDIVVELARELNLNEEDKKAHNRRIQQDTAAAIARGKKLEEIGRPDTGANRMLLRLWEETNPGEVLDRRCPYCAGPLGIAMLFNGEADVDHIIPYSRSLDDSAANKVVAHRNCNRQKGNKTPYERWHDDEVRWEKITQQASRMHKSKQWRFGPDAMQRYEDGGFIARQLTDTQYLSRLAGQYLSSLYPLKEDGSVYVIPGRMTAMLRRLWGLNSILPDHNYVENKHSGAPKNRLDHRHHAIDAAVIAITDRSLLMRIARTAGQAEDKNLDRLFEGLEPPWSDFRDGLRESLDKVAVSHKADHGRRGQLKPSHDMTSGRLHNDTAYGLTGEVAKDGKTPIVVHRIALTALGPAHLETDSCIPDETLREALIAATRGLSGKDFEAALKRFGIEHPLFRGIRHVRVREALNVIPIRDKAGRAYKAYKGDSNARFEVWRMPDGKWVPRVVSTFDAHRPDAAVVRPHPAAKRVLNLRQNDMVAVEPSEADTKILRVVKFSSAGQITLAGNREAGALKTRDAIKDDPFSYVYSSASGLKKLKARQLRVDPLGRVSDPGARD